jgi:calcineurin-like phosphoesterase family protein
MPPNKLHFVSDTHFCHDKIIKHDGLPFRDVEEMNDCLVANWNSNVRPDHHVVHLGDFIFGNAKRWMSLIPRLNGNIYLFWGNHDDIGLAQMDKLMDEHPRFRCALIAGFISAADQLIWVSHYAHMSWPKFGQGAWHVCGHSHGHLEEIETAGKSILDVSLVNIARLLGGEQNTENYRPLTFAEVEHFICQKNKD